MKNLARVALRVNTSGLIEKNYKTKTKEFAYALTTHEWVNNVKENKFQLKQIFLRLIRVKENQKYTMGEKELQKCEQNGRHHAAAAFLSYGKTHLWKHFASRLHSDYFVLRFGFFITPSQTNNAANCRHPYQQSRFQDCLVGMESFKMYMADYTYIFSASASHCKCSYKVSFL